MTPIDGPVFIRAHPFRWSVTGGPGGELSPFSGGRVQLVAHARVEGRSVPIALERARLHLEAYALSDEDYRMGVEATGQVGELFNVSSESAYLHLAAHLYLHHSTFGRLLAYLARSRRSPDDISLEVHGAPAADPGTEWDGEENLTITSFAYTYAPAAIRGGQ